MCFFYIDSSISEKEWHDLQIHHRFEISEVRVNSQAWDDDVFVGKKAFSVFVENEILRDWIIPLCSTSIIFTRMTLYHPKDFENGFETVFKPSILGEEDSYRGLCGYYLTENLRKELLEDGMGLARHKFIFNDVVGFHEIRINFPGAGFEIQSTFWNRFKWLLENVPGWR